MKRIVAAALAAGMGLAYLLGPARADDRSETFKRIAEAMAFSSRCEADLAFNGAKLRTLAIEHNFDLGEGSDETFKLAVLFTAREQSLKTWRDDEVCAVAVELYGPAGKRIPDLLRYKQ